MLVEFGNRNAKDLRGNAIGDNALRVTYLHIPDPFEDADGVLCYDVGEGLNVEEARRHIDRGNSAYQSLDRQGVTRLHELGAGGNEAFLAAVHPSGAWARHSADFEPTFVAVGEQGVRQDHEDRFEQYLSEFFQCPAGRPDGLEDLYHTRFGPPGVGPWANPVNGLLTNVGRTLWANSLGGGQVGTSGTATATTATSLTTGAITSVSANQYAGYRLYSPTAWANIISHTSGTTPVFTLDRWYSYATPGGAAATTPGATTTYVIADGGSVSNWFVGLTTTNITPAVGDTSLSGEATTNGMGRKIAPFAVTSAVNPASYTLTPVYTFTGSSGTTFYAIGVFNSMVVGDTTDTMLFETSLSSNFTVSANGDQATITETVSGS